MIPDESHGKGDEDEQHCEGMLNHITVKNAIFAYV